MAIILPSDVIQQLDNLKFTDDEIKCLDTFKKIISQSSTVIGEIHEELLKLKSADSKTILDSINKNLNDLQKFSDTTFCYQDTLKNTNQFIDALIGKSSAKRDEKIPLEIKRFERDIESGKGNIGDCKKSIADSNDLKKIEEDESSKILAGMHYIMEAAKDWWNIPAKIQLPFVIMGALKGIAKCGERINDIQKILDTKQAELSDLQKNLKASKTNLVNAKKDLENEKQKPEILRKVFKFGNDCFLAMGEFQDAIDHVISLYKSHMEAIIDEPVDKIERENQAFLKEMKLRMDAFKNFPVFDIGIIKSKM